MSKKYYVLVNGNIVIESTLQSAFEITTGLSCEEERDKYKSWLNSLPTYPEEMQMSNSAIQVLAETGHIAFAAKCYYDLYKHEEGTTLMAAKNAAQECADNPNLRDLATELDDIDKSFDFYDYQDRLENGQKDFVDQILSALEQHNAEIDRIKEALIAMTEDLDPEDEIERFLIRRINVAKKRIDNYVRSVARRYWLGAAGI